VIYPLNPYSWLHFKGTSLPRALRGRREALVQLAPTGILSIGGGKYFRGS